MNSRRKLLSILLSVAMICNMGFTPVIALAAEVDAQSSLCEHHSEHTADCGYSEGTPCAFDPADCEICNPQNSGKQAEDTGLSKHADTEKAENVSVTVTALSPLSDEVKEQAFPVGTSEEDVLQAFPQEIEATTDRAVKVPVLGKPTKNIQPKSKATIHTPQMSARVIHLQMA